MVTPSLDLGNFYTDTVMKMNSQHLEKMPFTYRKKICIKKLLLQSSCLNKLSLPE